VAILNVMEAGARTGNSLAARARQVKRQEARLMRLEQQLSKEE
jgi:hypothetical protein